MRVFNWSIVVCAALLTASTGAEKALEDTEANRLAQANNVLEASPIEETLENMIKEVSKGQGAAQTAAMRKAIEDADTSVLTKAFREAYISTFTAEELAYLAEYSASETGKRVQQKMPQYVSKITPVMQEFVKEAFGQADERAKAGAGQRKIDSTGTARKASSSGGRQKKTAADDL